MKNFTFFSIFSLFCSLCCCFNSFGSTPSKDAPSILESQLLIRNKTFLFEENKGQLIDENHRLISDIKYYGHQAGVNVYCKPGMISFVFIKKERENSDLGSSEASSRPVETQYFESKYSLQQFHRPTPITTSRIDLMLVGSSPSTQITASDQQSYYENFYTTGDANIGITNVHTFKTVTYKNIYPNIDMVLSTREPGLEYSFLVHPGGNLKNIKLKWNGTNKEEFLKEGSIRYSNSQGTLKESAPESFVEGKLVKSSFTKIGKSHSFKIGDYDRKKDLLIDPTLIWASYFGGSGDEYGIELNIDASQNVYITGSTSSTNNIATTGAYQTSFTGAQDAYLAKFNSSGNLLWSTYYGGNNEKGCNVKTDDSLNVYLTGQTASKIGIATSGASQTSFGGGNFDAFLAKFSSAGIIRWATYYGGDSDDVGKGITLDVSGNIFISGVTSSTGIATTGAFQTSYGGNGDAFLAKFSNSGKLVWATYYGGSGADEGDGISSDLLGNIYLSGLTGSNSGLTTNGAYQVSLIGSEDAFLAKFNNTGNISWATYFGGGKEIDIASVCADATGNVYITSATSSTNNIATSGAYQTSLSGGSNALLAKFNSSGSILWATYFGGDNYSFGFAVNTDVFGNIFVVGSTSSTTGIATSGAYQSSYGGGFFDAFLAIFNSSGKLSYATYCGGTNEDVGTGIAADNSGNAYITGRTNSNNGIATTNSYQTIYGGGAWDAYLAKFNIPVSGIHPGVDPNLSCLTIFPNPFSNHAQIEFNLLKSAYGKISLTNVEGKTIYVVADKIFSPGKNEIEINASILNLPTGLYILNFAINDQFISREIIQVK